MKITMDGCKINPMTDSMTNHKIHSRTYPIRDPTIDHTTDPMTEP